jgi:hypothetical protein
MSTYDHLPASKPVPRRAKKEPVFGVGWRAFVNWAGSAEQSSCPVPLADSRGLPLANDLADGDEVEILAWRPRSREGVSYQIQRLSDGSHWWITAAYLRRSR